MRGSDRELDLTGLDRRHGNARPARTGTPAIEVRHLTKKFGGRTAVADASFNVARGEVFGFLGPNGAGKTTTVRIIGTLIAPTSGSVEVAGIPLSPASGAEIRQRISIMPEAPGLYRRLTVTDNLEFFARLYGLPHPEARIAEALAAVNLSERAHDSCGSLSKGLRQRVALARTLLNDPEVMFLDEPTSGLDPVAAHEVHGLISGLRERGVTVFLTTHRLDEAERLCDRVAIMNSSLRTIGRPDELRQTLFSRSLTVTTAAPLADPGASPVVAAAVWHSPELLAMVFFIPLLATWAIWIGLAISSKASEIRTAQQLGTLARLPPLVLTFLTGFHVIDSTAVVAVSLGGVLLVIDCVAYLLVSKLFDRERLVTGTKRATG